MNQSFFIILNQLISFFLMMIVGYLAAHLRIVSREFLDGLSALIMKILLPILIFANMMNGTSRSQLAQDFPILFLSAAMYIALICIFALMAKLLRLPRERGQIFQAAFIFGNVGFIGIPLVMGISPEHGAIYVALMSIIDQGLLWTYGLYLTTPCKDTATFSWKNFLNPALGAIALGILLLLCDFHLPEVVESSFLTIGGTATPLSLVYIGGLLFFCNWKTVVRQKELYVGIVVKMICFPLLFCAAASLFTTNTDMIHVVSLLSGLPAMVTIAMFAQARHKEGEYALGMVLVETVASLFTLTLVAWCLF